MSSTTSSSSLLLCVLVKSANISNRDSSSFHLSLSIDCSSNDLDEICSYVVLKIDNVKSTTTVVKGSEPKWEQEFYL